MKTATDSTTSAFALIDGERWRCDLNGWQRDVPVHFTSVMRRPRFELGCPKAPDPKSGTLAGKVVSKSDEGASIRHLPPLSATPTATENTTWPRRIRTQKAREEWASIVEALGGRCAYCGVARERMCREHMIPAARGGDNGIENVTLACIPCNSSKGNRTPLEWFLGITRRSRGDPTWPCTATWIGDLRGEQPEPLPLGAGQ